MQVYTVEEVAKQLKVSPRTVERLIARQHLPAVQVGRRLRVTEEQLQAYLRQYSTVLQKDAPEASLGS
jgi:excisionase family DNA binding protein